MNDYKVGDRVWWRGNEFEIIEFIDNVRGYDYYYGECKSYRDSFILRCDEIKPIMTVRA